MPTASAPAMSSSNVSPTIAASPASTFEQVEHRREIDACGFVFPWWKELIRRRSGVQ